eukprot:351856-Chlamydomonas_euryale.AAC.1
MAHLAANHVAHACVNDARLAALGLFGCVQKGCVQWGVQSKKGGRQQVPPGCVQRCAGPEGRSAAS